ncbi:40S ribosomal protein S17, putative [Trypanosoma cruzi]|uniref:40S ribosomal protein S17, putative n=3 Tax=Trypanosoma cruzi TaxID=5693 RepID=Q4DK40_TRYCC|nr:40S ribosomal protein S17, putative [Trypanosoma cruzi]EAN92891.1 40S ribosomal protein S17, putative [Trypanosoma cruzi]5OPT_k Chain k, 40S ribosomal protein S17, putative [Trypanosoma cruzi strain CL Brener]|eukprot:XP_814742.1 40S ribosomal protein S17 [Trypanosoma cruzi strain CL Brener]
MCMQHHTCALFFASCTAFICFHWLGCTFGCRSFLFFFTFGFFSKREERVQSNTASMGKIRTKTVKRASKQLVEKYFSKLNKDFYQNKRVVMDVTIARSKKLKNKIAGYTTHIMKRLARGPVRGISLKLQEEERERRMDYVPEVSHVDQAIQDGVHVDKQTFSMLKRMETGVPRHVALTTVVAPVTKKGGRRAPARK